MQAVFHCVVATNAHQPAKTAARPVPSASRPCRSAPASPATGNPAPSGVDALLFLVGPGPQVGRSPGGERTVNGDPYDRDVVSATIPEGTAERWTIINGGGSWSHPVHIHYEEHRSLLYNRAAPPPLETCRKDVIRLDPNAEVEIYLRFRDYKGLYVMHCHNVVHEDHAMMVNWKIV